MADLKVFRCDRCGRVLGGIDHAGNAWMTGIDRMNDLCSHYTLESYPNIARHEIRKAIHDAPMSWGDADLTVIARRTEP